MLQPTNRLTLIDAMRPPSDYRFDAAMAVTFTLDLRALLAAPAAFALAARHDTDTDDPQAEPIELLHAIRAHSSRITVFSQAGEIALPPSRRVFAFLERSVVPVTAPRGGLVHPKVWVLRYVDPSGEEPPRFRALSATRNLTFDTSWDTVLRLDSDDGEAGTRVDAIADLFAALCTRSVGRIDPDHSARVAALCEDLRRVTFAIPEGVDDLRVHVLGLDQTAPPFPATSDRSLVISPFVSDDFFAQVHPAPISELVSRPESLDGLKASSLDSVETAYAFDDGSTPDPSGDEEHLAAEDPGRPLRGVHAKVFVYETGSRAQLFCGSANATGAAFGRNVEILFELAGSTARLGIDRLCSGSDDELGLRALFQTYVRSAPEAADPGEASLDSLRHEISRMSITGVVEPSGDEWAVTYETSSLVSTPPGVEAVCWPLAAPGNRRVVVPNQPLTARFEVSLETISGFLAFQLEHHDSGLLTQFVVPVELQGVPEHRNSHLLRSLIGNADRFLRYLLALLAEDAAGMDLLDAIEDVGRDEPGDKSTAPGGLPVLESMLRTLRRNPAKLMAVDPLISDLATDGALPPGFSSLWSNLRSVAVAAEGER
ncbi:MAG: phospholipase D family protein [Actinomycetota bacterium]